MRFLLSIEVNSHPLQPVEGSGGVYSNAISIGSGFFPLGSDGLGFASGLVFQPNGERGPLMNLRPSLGTRWNTKKQIHLAFSPVLPFHPCSEELRREWHRSPRVLMRTGQGDGWLPALCTRPTPGLARRAHAQESVSRRKLGLDGQTNG